MNPYLSVSAEFSQLFDYIKTMGEVGACLATEMTSYVSDIAEHVLGIRERRGEPRLTNCVGIHSTLLSIFPSIAMEQWE